MGRRLRLEQLNLPDGKEKFSLKEAAAALGVHYLTLYNWERRNQLPVEARPARLKRNQERIYSRAKIQVIWRWLTETVEDSAA